MRGISWLFTMSRSMVQSLSTRFSNTSRCVSDCERLLPSSMVMVCPMMSFESSEFARSMRLS